MAGIRRCNGVAGLHQPVKTLMVCEDGEGSLNCLPLDSET